VFLVYDPMPVDPYHPVPQNRQRPVGGTTRLTPGGGVLGADLHHAGAFPLRIAWRDADQSPGTIYLPVLTGISRLKVPEYVVPAGFPYHDCFTRGDCSNNILDAIYQTTMEISVVYLAVDPPYGDFQVVPLKMAGPAWSPVAAARNALSPKAHNIGNFNVYLPMVSSFPQAIGCPCGVFTGYGRMVYYIAE